MRILQVHTAYRFYGGEDRVVQLEADALRGAGHEVVPVLDRNPSDALGAARKMAVSLHNPAAARRVVEAAARARADVAHVHNTWFAQSPSVVRALSRAGVPVVVTVHNYRTMCAASTLLRHDRPCTACVGTHPWRGVVHNCYGSLVRSTVASSVNAVHRSLGTWHEEPDVVVALSQAQRTVLLRDGFAPDRVVVKPNFTTDPGPRPAPPSVSRDVVFVGRLAREKGVGTLLEAWRRARPASARLLVAGVGPVADDLARDLPPGVVLLGQRPAEEIGRLLLEARALVFPSQWEEPFGLALVEALAAGLPVVATDVGAVREILPAEGADAVVPARDPDALAAALRSVLERDDLVDRLSKAGRGHYLATYTPDVAVGRHEALLDLAVARRRARSGTGTAAPGGPAG